MNPFQSMSQTCLWEVANLSNPRNHGKNSLKSPQKLNTTFKSTTKFKSSSGNSNHCSRIVFPTPVSKKIHRRVFGGGVTMSSSWEPFRSRFQTDNRNRAHFLAWFAVFFCFFFWIHTPSAPITSGTHTDGGGVISYPGSAWLEGTPAMDYEMNGKRVHMYSNQIDIEHHTYQETRSMDEEHTCETTIMFIFIWFFFSSFGFFYYCFFLYFLAFFHVITFIDLLVYIYYYVLNAGKLYWLDLWIIVNMFLDIFPCVFMSFCFYCRAWCKHPPAREQPVAAGTQRIIIIGVYSL